MGRVWIIAGKVLFFALGGICPLPPASYAPEYCILRWIKCIRVIFSLKNNNFPEFKINPEESHPRVLGGELECWVEPSIVGKFCTLCIQYWTQNYYGTSKVKHQNVNDKALHSRLPWIKFRMQQTEVTKKSQIIHVTIVALILFVFCRTCQTWYICSTITAGTKNHILPCKQSALPEQLDKTCLLQKFYQLFLDQTSIGWYFLCCFISEGSFLDLYKHSKFIHTSFFSEFLSTGKPNKVHMMKLFPQQKIWSNISGAEISLHPSWQLLLNGKHFAAESHYTSSSPILISIWRCKAQNKWCTQISGIAIQSPHRICSLLHKITPKLIRNVKNCYTKWLITKIKLITK
jgi:hypothetical protein